MYMYIKFINIYIYICSPTPEPRHAEQAIVLPTLCLSVAQLMCRHGAVLVCLNGILICLPLGNITKKQSFQTVFSEKY